MIYFLSDPISFFRKNKGPNQQIKGDSVYNTGWCNAVSLLKINNRKPSIFIIKAGRRYEYIWVSDYTQIPLNAFIAATLSLTLCIYHLYDKLYPGN